MIKVHKIGDICNGHFIKTIYNNTDINKKTTCSKALSYIKKNSENLNYFYIFCQNKAMMVIVN